MRDAIQHGADMVEFDVQVSKDLVPVIYHEFRLCVQTRSKQGSYSQALLLLVELLYYCLLIGRELQLKATKFPY